MLGSSSCLLHTASLSLLLVHIAVLIPPARPKHHGSRPSLFGVDSEHAQDLPNSPAEPERSHPQTLVAVRKMTDIEHEMFFQHFWQFDFGSTKTPDDTPSKAMGVPERPTNASIPLQLQPPLALHHIADRSSPNAHWARALLQPTLWDRDFKCPTGTDACTAIDRSTSCCPSGSTCQLVTNGGRGDLACCRSGQTCTGDVQDCAEGYQKCPAAEGGGCCIPGFACVGTVGCVRSSTTTVIVNPSVTASPPSSSSTSSLPQTTTANTTPDISTSQTTITTSTTSTSSSSPPPPSSPTTTSSGNAFIPPARPTSAAVVTTSSLSAAAPICPTGFYQCSAYYHGGCCRVGRDCGLTDCPTSGSTTVAVNNGNGVTVVAPSPTRPLLDTGNCASGWQSCARDVGGGCCPGDFECGVESCTKGAGAKVTTGVGEGGVSVGKGAGEGLVSGGCRVSRWGTGGIVMMVVVVGIGGSFPL
ncbi:hypothetical protein XPA_007596 [Xanthoria parietina]